MSGWHAGREALLCKRCTAGLILLDGRVAGLKLAPEFSHPGAAMTGNGSGALRQILEAAAREARLPLSDLTVLDKKVDPYRQDTPADTATARGSPSRWRGSGSSSRSTCAGLHYALVSSTSLTKPNGARYLNNADDWEWLQVEASKAARWLGYVPFDRIVDQRNYAAGHRGARQWRAEARDRAWRRRSR